MPDGAFTEQTKAAKSQQQGAEPAELQLGPRHRRDAGWG